MKKSGPLSLEMIDKLYNSDDEDEDIKPKKQKKQKKVKGNKDSEPSQNLQMLTDLIPSTATGISQKSC